jgi:hypothetical protein
MPLTFSRLTLQQPSGTNEIHGLILIYFPFLSSLCHLSLVGFAPSLLLYSYFIIYFSSFMNNFLPTIGLSNGG